MALTYRTSGSWGSGKGSNLTPAEVDANFYQLTLDIAAKAEQGVGIANFNVTGNQLTVVLTDHTLLGPFTLPTVTLTFKGEWLPDTDYFGGDVFTAEGSTYLVTYNHTSDATFDPGANDGLGHDYYGLLLENPALSIPAGGGTDFVLAKNTGTDYDLYWKQNNLATLADVIQSPGPTTGDLISWNGTQFTYVPQNEVVGAAPNLSELGDVLPSPAPTDGQVVIWDATAGAFTYGTPAGAALSTLSDVSIGTPIDKAALFFDLGSGTWYNDYYGRQYVQNASGSYTITDDALDRTVTLSAATVVNLPANGALVSSASIQLRQSGSAPFHITTSAGATINVPLGYQAYSRGSGAVVNVHPRTTGDGYDLDGDLRYATNVLDTSGVITITPAASASEVYTLGPTGDVTLNADTPTPGTRLYLIVTTVNTTSRTISFSTGFKATGSLTTGTVSGKVFVLSFIGDGTNLNEVSRTTAM